VSGTFFKVVKKVLCLYPPTLIVILSFLKTSNKLSPVDEILLAILINKVAMLWRNFCFPSITKTFTEISEISVNLDIRAIPYSTSKGVPVLIKSHSQWIV